MLKKHKFKLVNIGSYKPLKFKKAILDLNTGDILIVACGQPEMITSEYVKEGAVVIDVGINSVEDKNKKHGYRIVGDVHFKFVEEKCSYLTPVPGGIGPMTIAMLLSHVVKLASLV